MTTVSTTAAASAAPAVTTKSAALDQSAFLKLMTTQLQTQDPFAPVDNTQMVAQLAQFSSVAGIAEMNASLKTIADQVGGSRVADAAGWIGREALVSSTSAAARADGSFAGQVTLPSASTATSLSLVDANGAVVHAEALGAQPQGAINFAWDGKDAAGNPVKGPLKVVVAAQDAAGAAITPGVATWTSVTGIQSPAGGAATKIVTPIGTFAPGDAQMIG